MQSKVSWRNFLAVLWILAFCATIVWAIIAEKFSPEIFVILGICLLLLFRFKLDKWLEKRIKKKRESTYCVFGGDHILFPGGYYFRHGFMKGKNSLPYSFIQEIRINTFPACAKINGNELIFLFGQNKEKIIEMAKLKNIPLTEPQDNWSFLCEEFLDTEVNEDEKEMIAKRLEEVGIGREEAEEIKSKIKFRMLMYTYFSLEWEYYGQYDVMTQLAPLSEKKYWWTMEIALRSR